MLKYASVISQEWLALKVMAYRAARLPDCPSAVLSISLCGWRALRQDPLKTPDDLKPAGLTTSACL